MSHWDENVPFERNVETNWCEEALELDINNSEVTDEDCKSTSWKIEREDIISEKDVFLLNPCFSIEECMKIIEAAEMIGYGRTNYPKRYR